MGTIQEGAYQAVNNCVRLKPDEKAVIITDNKTKNVAQAISDAAEKISPDNITFCLIESYGIRDSSGTNPMKLPYEIRNGLKNAQVSFYVADGKLGERLSFRKPMLELVEKNKIRHAHCPGIDKEIMVTGMCVDYNSVQRISKRVKEVVEEVEYITVTTPAGTEFTAQFDLNWRWVSSDGKITSDKWENLPGGEVFTCAKDIYSGIIVVDGIIGDQFENYGLLEKTPVKLYIEKGEVRKIESENEKLVLDLNRYIRLDKNAKRIGEFAFGTNIGLEKLVGNLLQDEKFPGIHIAIGSGYPEKTGSDWNSDAHADCILLRPTVSAEGQVIMKNGKYIF